MLQAIKNQETVKMALSVKEAANELAVSAPYVRLEIRNGNLKAKKVGRRVLILRESLKSYLDNQPDWKPENTKNGDDEK